VPKGNESLRSVKKAWKRGGYEAWKPVESLRSAIKIWQSTAIHPASKHPSFSAS